MSKVKSYTSEKGHSFTIDYDKQEVHIFTGDEEVVLTIADVCDIYGDMCDYMGW